MTQLDLLALLPGDGPCPDDLLMVSAGQYRVVLAKARRLNWRDRTRKAALRGLVDRQRDFERLMTCGTVLPVLPGTQIAASAVPVLVAANEPLLDRLARQLAGRVQFQITIHWPDDAAAAYFGWPDDVAATRGAAALRARVFATVADASEDQTELPSAPGVFFNSVVLVPNDAVARLDVALEDIDAIWPDGFRIRCVGPSPAVSFASLGMHKITPKAVQAARAALALPPGATGEAIAAARRRVLMSSKPDLRPALTTAADLLEASTRAGTDTFGHLYTWSEGRASISDDARNVA